MRNALVLVVDDEPDLRNLMALLLGEWGYQVHTAQDGRQALADVAKQMPQLILLDMKMPVMNGWEFAKTFHDTFGRRAAIIIVVTAADDAAARAREIGADGWLGKPFGLDEFQAVIQPYLNGILPHAA